MANVINFATNRSGRRSLMATAVEPRTEALEPPGKLTKRERAVWDKFIEPATWLSQSDTALAYAWTKIFARFLAEPDEMPAAMLSQMRLLAGDLGLNPGEQQRLSSALKKSAADEKPEKPKFFK